MVCREAVPSAAQLRELAAAGWSVAVESHWPTLRRDGVTVRWLPAWTGRAMSIADAAAFWQAMRWRLGRVAHGAVPIGSPGTTGRDLWLRLMPGGAEFPVLAGPVADWLRAISGQGRVQVLPPAAAAVPRVVEIDQRLAYLAVMRNLPAGKPEWLDGDPASRWAVGKASARWQAPKGWRRASPFAPGGWQLNGQGWVDLAEVAAARSAGWHVWIDAAVVWPRTCDPYRTWAARIREQIDSPPAVIDRRVWRAAWRAIALHTVGAMHGAPRRTSHYGDVPPADAVRPRLTDGGVFRWETTAPALWPTTLHPEWTSAIWSRARLRLLTGPLRTGEWHLPDGIDCIGFRTDALYLTGDPGWPDDGAPGRFRVKRVGGGRAWPTGQAELLDGLTEVTP